MNISSSTREVAVLDAKNADFVFYLTVTYIQNVSLRQKKIKQILGRILGKNFLTVRSATQKHIHPSEMTEGSLIA